MHEWLSQIALIAPQLGGGTIRPLLQLGRKRLELINDTETAIEAGFPDFEALAWWGVFAPKDTPPALVESLAQAVKSSLADPNAVKLLQETQQMTLVLGGPAELKTFFATQVDVWGKVVRDNKIKA